MQELVNAIRATGATQPVMLGGLDFADDLSQWTTHKPTDPLNQEAASFHNYMGKECDNVGCWNSEVAPVAATVPVVTGEFAEDNYENPTCPEGPSNFDNEYMGWADAHGVSYLAWAWVVLSAAEIKSEGCSAFYLIGDYSGTPASVNGIAVRNHLLALPPGGRSSSPTTNPGGGAAGGGGKTTPSPIALTKFGATVLAGGKVRFQLQAAQSCAAKIDGQTVKPFKLGGRKPHNVGLGAAHASLTAGKPTTVTLTLPAKARALLKANGSLRARYTVTLSGGGTTSSTPHTITLKLPKPKKH
jgi:Cellulase (glycosyl hydrolase family 5)